MPCARCLCFNGSRMLKVGHLDVLNLATSEKILGSVWWHPMTSACCQQPLGM